MTSQNKTIKQHHTVKQFNNNLALFMSIVVIIVLIIELVQ